MAAKRVLRIALRSLALVLVFVVACVVGLVAHLDLAAPRAFAKARVNELLASTFRGDVRVVAVGGLGLDHVEGVEAIAFDPEGHRVAWVRGARGQVRLAELILSLVHGDATVIPITKLEVDAGEVALDRDDAGELRLGRAFASRRPSSAEPARATRVELRDVVLRHVWAHGDLVPGVVLDADVDDAAGSFESFEGGIGFVVVRAEVRGRGNPGLDPVGTVAGHAFLPSRRDALRSLSATFEGRIGEVVASARASMDGASLAASGDFEVSPGAARRIAEEARLRQTVRLRLEASGALPVVAARVQASSGSTEVEASSVVTLPAEDGRFPAGSLRVTVRKLDLGALREGLPRTLLGFELSTVFVARSMKELWASFSLRTEPGSVGDTMVPALVAGGTLVGDALRATVDVAEPGLPVHAEISVDPAGPGGDRHAVAFSAAAQAPDLRGIARWRPSATGSAELDLRGVFLVEDKVLEATGSARLRNVGVRGARAGLVTLQGEVAGPIDSPRLAVGVEASDLYGYGYSITALRGRASGTAERASVEVSATGGPRTPSGRIQATVGLEPHPYAEHVRVALERAGVRVDIGAASVHKEDGFVIVDRAKVEGLGQPLAADLRIGRGELDLRAATSGVELARVARLVDLREDIRGYLVMDADLHAAAGGATGRVDAFVAGLRIPRLGTANVRVKGRIDQRTIRAEGEAELVGAGRVEIKAMPVTLDGPFLRAASWRRATGTVDVRGRVRLDTALERIPEEERLVSAASGRVALDVRASRERPEARPNVDLQVLTQGLVLVGPRPAPRAGGPPPPPGWQLRDVDGTVRLDHDPDSGRTNAEVKLRDRRGLLVSVDVAGKLPIDALLEAPAKALPSLADVPLEARLQVHRRSIASLPPVLGRIPFEGVVELDARHEGTLRAPKIEASGRAEGLRAREAPRGRDHPVDLEAILALSGTEGRAHLTGRAEKRLVLDADATVSFEPAAALVGGAGRWRGSADVTLTRFPLDILQAALGRPIMGTASGALSIRDLHENARLAGALELRGVQVDKAVFPRARVELAIEDGALRGKLRLDQQGGYAEAHVASGVAWGVSLTPSLVRDQRAEVRVQARALRLAFLNPILGDVATGLDGRLWGHALVRSPGPGQTTVEGALEIKDGALSVAQIGEQIRDIDAKLVVSRGGKVTLERLTARAPTGRLSGKGSAELDGLSLKRAAGELRVEEGQSIPVAFEGVPMGQVYGTVMAKAERSPKTNRLEIDLDVPLLHVELPRRSGRSVQKLTPPEHIRTGVFKGRAFKEIGLKPSKPPRSHADLVVRTTIDLGDRVSVRRGTTLDVVIRGRVTIESNGEARVTGTIHLVRGELEIQGRVFTIDRGVVTFSGPDPENPQIVATAYWDAPDGTRVFAEFSGNVAEGKLDLRSEPALSQDQIVSLIAFGSADGGLGATAATAGAGASVAGGILTQGINDIISGITPDITTRIDTSESGNPKPEVAIQISSRVSARLGYAVGAPSAGDAPDRATVTLDWRFYKDWSIAAEVGDHGSTAVDVVWRVRY